MTDKNIKKDQQLLEAMIKKYGKEDIVKYINENFEDSFSGDETDYTDVMNSNDDEIIKKKNIEKINEYVDKCINQSWDIVSGTTTLATIPVGGIGIDGDLHKIRIYGVDDFQSNKSAFRDQLKYEIYKQIYDMTYNDAAAAANEAEISLVGHRDGAFVDLCSGGNTIKSQAEFYENKNNEYEYDDCFYNVIKREALSENKNNG